MNIYLLGSLVSFVLLCLVVYFDKDKKDLKLEDLAVFMLFPFLSWVGVVIELVIVLGMILSKVNWDKVIFVLRK